MTALSGRGLAVLALLQADLEAGGLGLRLAELAASTGCLYPAREIRALRDAGHWIASVNDRFQLLDPASSEPSETVAPTRQGSPGSPSSDGSLDAGPRLFEPVSTGDAHWVEP